MMNWDALGAIAEIFGAIGVIVTLVYLANQIAQTNRVANTANIREIEQQYLDLYKLIASDPVFTELVTKLRDPEYRPGSDIDEERLINFAAIVGTIWFSTQVAYDRGQVDEDPFQVYRDDVKIKLAEWPAIKPYVKDFVANYPSQSQSAIFTPLFN